MMAASKLAAATSEAMVKLKSVQFEVFGKVQGVFFRKVAT